MDIRHKVPGRKSTIGPVKDLEMTEKGSYDVDVVIINSQDENTSRGNWSGRFDFILSALGSAVGLGNVWRFPYLCYKNGGGIFFIPYFIFLAFVGIPIFLLELTMGQFTSQCQLTCWNNAKLFTGIGLAMTIVSGLISIYYNVIMAWSFWYLFTSFRAELPWNDCSNYDSTNLCWTKYREINATGCTNIVGASFNTTQGICYVNNSLYAVVNKTLSKTFGLSKRTVAEDYLMQVGFQTKQSINLENLGSLRWDMSLSLLLAWMVPLLCMIKGIKSSGKVVYFTAIFPIIVLIILFFRGITLAGSGNGIKFFITPNITKLSDSLVWKDAAAQIFFSLSVSTGSMIVFGSYNKFHTNIIRDAFIVCIGNSLVSIFAGFTIFSYIGYLSKVLKVNIEDVAKSGVTLAFVVYPQAVTTLPFPPLWAILFFIMLITLGLDSQFGLLETVITGILDFMLTQGIIKKVTPKLKATVVSMICLVGFFLSLIMATPGGPYLLTLMDDYCAGWNIILVGLLECICIGWCYSAKRLCKDIEVMVINKEISNIHKSTSAVIWSYFRWYFIVTWTFITPALLIFIMIFSIVQYRGSTYGTYVFPMWSNAIGWCLSMLVVVEVIVPAVYFLITTKGDTLLEKLIELLTPNKYWGPALPSHRKKVQLSHAPNMLIHPDNITEVYDNPTFTNYPIY